MKKILITGTVAFDEIETSKGSSGKVIGGAKAFLIIWSNIPKYNFLYKVFSKKPLFILFHYAYEIAAYFLFLKNKHQLK